MSAVGVSIIGSAAAVLDILDGGALTVGSRRQRYGSWPCNSAALLMSVSVMLLVVSLHRRWVSVMLLAVSLHPRWVPVVGAGSR